MDQERRRGIIHTYIHIYTHTYIQMLVVDPSKRFTAIQCLEHAWIKNAGEASAKKMHSSHRAFLLIRKLSIFDNIDPACLQEITTRLKVVKAEAVCMYVCISVYVCM